MISKLLHQPNNLWTDIILATSPNHPSLIWWSSYRHMMIIIQKKEKKMEKAKNCVKHMQRKLLKPRSDHWKVMTGKISNPKRDSPLKFLNVVLSSFIFPPHNMMLLTMMMMIWWWHYQRRRRWWLYDKVALSISRPEGGGSWYFEEGRFFLWMPDLCETVFSPISIENIFECHF